MVVGRVYAYLARLMSQEAGQDLVEYAMVTMFVSVAIVTIAAAAGIVPAFGVLAGSVTDCLAGAGPLNC